jgi:alkylation response protein AidB-like acyl-CoA dehydrogenase
VILAEEFAKAGVPGGGPNDVFGIQMVGNTILQWGTEEQKRALHPEDPLGEHVWCQGYSEPNAGSDLGNLGCRAVLDGDEWVINGQKIWTSAGHLANWIFVLARTDPDAPSTRGITFLLVPDGPARRRGAAHQDDLGRLRVQRGLLHRRPLPEGQRRRGVNNGWAVAMTLLGYERGEAAATIPVMFRHELDRLIGLAREQGAADDPVSASGSPGATARSRSCAGRAAHAHPVPRRPPARPREPPLQALLERVPPALHRAGRRHPRPRRP